MDKYLIWAPGRSSGAWSSNNHERFVRLAIENARRCNRPIRIFRNLAMGDLIDYCEISAEDWDVAFGEEA